MRVGAMIASTLLTAAPAEAAVFTQTANFGRFVQASFNQLAPDAGPLLEVRLDWTASAIATYPSVYLPEGPPPTPRPLVIDYGIYSNFAFFFPDVSYLEWSDIAGLDREEFAFVPSSFVLSTVGTSQALVAAADLARFVGTDIIRVGGGADIRITSLDFGGWPIEPISTPPDRAGNGTVTITYLTGEVPEPVGWALMIAGFGLVGAALRRHGSGCLRMAALH